LTGSTIPLIISLVLLFLLEALSLLKLTLPTDFVSLIVLGFFLAGNDILVFFFDDALVSNLVTLFIAVIGALL
jgi:hypothetical protein